MNFEKIVLSRFACRQFRPGGEQQAGALHSALIRSAPQGCPPMLIERVEPRAVLYQQLHDGGLVPLHCQVQGGTVPVIRIRIRPRC